MPALKLTPAQSDALDLIGSAFKRWTEEGERLRKLIDKHCEELSNDARHPIQALPELLDHPAIGYCRCHQADVAYRCDVLAVWTHPDTERRYCSRHAAEYVKCPGCSDTIHQDDARTVPVGGVGDLTLCRHCAEPHATPDAEDPING
jgi:hypothetical protein